MGSNMAEGVANVYQMTDKQFEEVVSLDEEHKGLMVSVVNTRAFNYLPFGENLTLMKQINNYQEFTGKGNKDVLDKLDSTSVYYFLKDGLKFGEWLEDDGDDRTFNKLIGETDSQYGWLYKQSFVWDTLSNFEQHIGEEMSYLLSLQAIDRITENHYKRNKEIAHPNYRHSCWSRIKHPIERKYKYFRDKEVSNLLDRDLFDEFELGLISNGGKKQLPEKEKGIKHTIKKLWVERKRR